MEPELALLKQYTFLIFTSSMIDDMNSNDVVSVDDGSAMLVSSFTADITNPG